MWMVALLATPLLAATSEDIAHGWYLAESGRMEQAAQLAARALADNPHDLQAHRLYVWTLQEGLNEGPALQQQYETWHAEEPDNDYARITLAGLLVGINEEEGAWCEQVEALLEPLPKDTGVRYWAHRYRYAARQVCPADAVEDRQALLDLAKVTPSALGISLRLRLESGKVDEALATDLQTFYSLEPWNIAFPGNLWGDDVKGPALRGARSDALAAARHALDADKPAYAQGAFRIFQYAANDAGRVAAETRRAELDPAWSTHDRAWNGERLSLSEGGRSALERSLDRARHKATIEAAFAAIGELEPRIPPHGPLRSIYLRELGYIQYRAGDEAAAFASFEQAWQEDSTNARAANGFAYLAALRGEKLDLALVVMDSILEGTPSYDPWNVDAGIGYETWSEQLADHLGARQDTRAWILHQLGRSEEAASVLQQAMLLIREPDPILHHHLGLVLLAMGQEDAALEQIGRGLAMGPSDEPELDALARAKAEELFTGRRWAPGGLDAWVATRPHPIRTVATREGEVLVDMELTVDDKPRMLSDFEGIKVVVFWSARSAAFADSLPTWQEITKRYRKDPIHFLGLCVDERVQATNEFWQGYRLPPLLLGWAGPQGAQLAQVGMLPTAYVVDAQGTIRGQVTGPLHEGDGRVEAWLDMVLAEAWEAEQAPE